ncbi:MAG: MFS transporter [Rhodocyclaceae bacterium]|nr:MFS transporter [Rhodocyclaceae bacterium]
MNGLLRKYGLFFILCLLGFATFFCSYLRIPVLPLFAASLGAGPAQVGMINGAFMLTTGVLSIPAGLLADRLGRKIPAIGGILATAVSSLLVAQCDSPSQMAAAYILFGAGLAAFAPSMLSLVADAMPQERLGQAYGWYTTGIYVAMTLGPAAGGILGKSLGLRQVFYLSGVLLLLVAGAAAILLPLSPLRRKGEFRTMLAASFSLLGNRSLLAPLVATIGISIGFGIFLSFLPLYASGKGLDPVRVGLIFAAHGLTNVVCRVPVGIVSDRVDRRGIVAAGLFSFAVGLSAMGLFEHTGSLAACAVLLGSGMALTFTALGALIAESVPPAQRGLAMGMFNSCIYLGLMAGSTGLGVFIGIIGYPAGFAVGASVALLTLGCFLLMMRSRGSQRR